MILIADSGSTKTEWCLIENEILFKRIITAGTNPYFQTKEEINAEIIHSLLSEIKNIRIESVHFYGAGCSTSEKKRIISNSIYSHIPVNIEIYSDLTGTARALYGNKSGIACILGTGSNSCLYNGKEIIQNISPLGYILGDEGSGAVLGKLLISDCLKNQLPTDIVKKFMDQYQLTTTTILERVYRQPFPNRYLASFSYFLLDNISEPAIYTLVFNTFRDFFLRNIMQYEGYSTLPISFTGSIAYYFQPVLKAVAESLSLQIGKIERSPMAGLITYHSSTTL